MATKKQKTWGTILGAIAGGIIAYQQSNEADNKLLKTLGGALLGGAGGYGLACVFGELDNTINYSCFYKKHRVYEGICYEDRIDARIIEHKMNGKKITHIRYDKPKPRSEAALLEKTRIKRFKPKYNIQHNCSI